MQRKENGGEDDAATSLGVEGRGGRLLQSKSNPNLSQIASFEVDGDIGRAPASLLEKQKGSLDNQDNETTSEGSRGNLESQKQKTKSGTGRGKKERPVRPVTPSYKSFLEDVSSAGNDAGKPPRPNSASLSSSSSEIAGESPSVLTSVDIVIEAS